MTRSAAVAALLGALVLAAPAAANQPPEIWTATVTPTSLPHTGGDVVVYVDAYDFEGAPICCLDIELDGLLVSSGQGANGETTVTIPPNYSSAPVTYTIRVIVRDYDLAEASAIAGKVVVAAVPALDAAPVVSDPSATPADLPSSGGPVTLGVTATDDFGVDYAFAFVTPSNGLNIPLVPVGGDRYEAVFNAPPNPGTGTIEYKVGLTAVDDLAQSTRADTVFRVAGQPSGRLETKTTALAFGSVKTGKRAQRSVTLRNVGAKSTLPVEGVLTTSGAPFFVAGAPATGGLPFCLRAGETMNVLVEFRPTAAGAKSGQLIVTRPDLVQTPLAVGLTGTGILKEQPTPAPAPAPARKSCR